MLRSTFELNRVESFPWIEVTGVISIFLFYKFGLFNSWVSLGFFSLLFLFSILMLVSKLTLRYISGF